MFTFNAYEVLEVSRTSSISEIKESFRKLVVSHHPDKLIQQKTTHSAKAMHIKATVVDDDINNNLTISNDNIDITPVGDGKISLLIAARNILCDPIQRKLHDDYLIHCESSHSNYLYNKVRLSEFAEDTSKQLYTFPCRCGDEYEITKLEIDEGINVIPCNTCSLSVYVIT